MHNNSPEQMPILHSPAPDVRSREKLEGGRSLVMHTEFQPAGDHLVPRFLRDKVRMQRAHGLGDMTIEGGQVFHPSASPD